MYRLILFLICALISLNSLQAQRVIYRYRYGPTLMDNMKQAAQSLRTGKMHIANASAEMKSIRTDFFNALKTNAPDLKEKEQLFYQALFSKDIIILNDYVTSYRYFGKEPVLTFNETFFGKVDGGIHTMAQDKFTRFAKAYMKHEDALTGGDPFKSTTATALDALERCQKEYESYRIARDWLEFEQQKSLAIDGEEKYKMFIMGLTNSLSENLYTYEESEKIYQEHLRLMGGHTQMNQIYDLIHPVFEVTKDDARLHLDRLSPAQQNQLYDLVWDFYMVRTDDTSGPSYLNDDMPYTNWFIEYIITHQKEGSAKKFVFFHLYAYTECAREVKCAINTVKNAQAAFGKEKVEAVFQKIYSLERRYDGWFYGFKEPLIVDGKDIHAPHIAFMPLLITDDRDGFIHFLCLYNQDERYQTVEDLAEFGEEKIELAFKRTYKDYLEKNAGFHHIASKMFFKELKNDIIDFTEDQYRRLPDYDKNYYGYKNYINSGPLPSDTLVIFTNMTKKDAVDPSQWTTSMKGEHIQGIAHGICGLYYNQAKPTVVKVQFFYDSQLEFQYFLEQKTGYKLATYELNGAPKSSNIMGGFSKYNMPCLYKKE